MAAARQQAMTLFDAFERIVVINLPQRIDRRREILVELARAGIAASDPRLQFFAAIQPDDAGDFPSIGAHGCYTSHLSVIEAALRDGIVRLLILEDDLQFGPAVCRAQPALAVRLLRDDWDIAYPGHIEALGGDPSGGDPSAPQWLVTEAPLSCAYFYGLNRRVLPALRDYLQSCLLRPAGHPDGGAMHVDGAFSMFRARARLVTLIAVPSLGRQRSSRSDIHPNRWYDRVAPIRGLASIARRLKNRLRS
jgi:glycosyl transferase family 25